MDRMEFEEELHLNMTPAVRIQELMEEALQQEKAILSVLQWNEENGNKPLPDVRDLLDDICDGNVDRYTDGDLNMALSRLLDRLDEHFDTPRHRLRIEQEKALNEAMKS